MKLLKSILAIAIVTALAWKSAFAADTPPIAAASDLKFALTEIAAAFHKETGREVKLTFGSSGNFFRQIQDGAPFQIFLSADEQFVLDLAAKSLTLDGGEQYAMGRLVLFAPNESSLEVDSSMSDLKAALLEGRVRKFAIANPDHAPYGARSVEALKTAGLWNLVKDRLVLGENVSQAAQFAASGSAQAGIIAFSLALAPDVSKLGTFALIPAHWHEPLHQRMVLLKTAGETARLFYAYMRTPAARRIMNRYGFTLPNENS